MTLPDQDAPPLRDIETRDDVVQLIDAFYEKVRVDDTIGYIFNDVAQVDWELHLPIMYDFWETLLLGARSYPGGAMRKHIDLAARTPLRSVHFERWLQLFQATVTELYAGDRAHGAVQLARNIAQSMQKRTRAVQGDRDSAGTGSQRLGAPLR